MTNVSIEDLMPYARHVVSSPERRRSKPGYVGYGNTKAGEKVLFAPESYVDTLVIEAMTRALREKGAKVDVLILDKGPDRELDETDEMKYILRKPWSEVPRVSGGIQWVEDIAEREHYDLLIHHDGPLPKTTYRYERFPWTSIETFTSGATVFPIEVHDLINRKTWYPVWQNARGGRVRVTDPEGTDMSWTLWEDYYKIGKWSETPYWGHVMAHPPVPLLPNEDARGVIAGTTSHLNKPFPRIEVHVEKGVATSIEGGGRYGEEWRKVLKESKDIQYPDFPRPGLFWMFEVATGTNPKIRRPRSFLMLSSRGSKVERCRSGIVHMGLGTSWRTTAEKWAGDHGFPYGHIHVHLLFPTLEVTTKDGEKIKLIEKGRLTALDDPEVRQVAAKYGDPNKLLKEDWIPKIPGINVPGDYEKDYACDPASWIKKELEAEPS